MFLPVMRPVAVALAAVGLMAQAQAASYTVPAGVINVSATLSGGGGGAGGADASGAAGAGAAGTLLAVTFPVQAGAAMTYDAGTGGASGESWEKLATNTTRPLGYTLSNSQAAYGMAGGAGGTGFSAGGKGGPAPLANYANPRAPDTSGPDRESGSGGGGGGGGGSYVAVNGLYAVAGGGGGGGGGGWNQAGTAGQPSATAFAAGGVANCAPGTAGTAGNDGNGQRSQTNNGGGGSGGGGGGYMGGAVGLAGFDNSAPAAGGFDGASCVSPGVQVQSGPSAGAAGSTGPSTSSGDAGTVPAVAPNGGNGYVSLIPNAVPTLTAGAPGSGSITVNASLPAPVYPTGFTQMGVSYAFTCDNGMSVPLGALPATVTGLTSGTTYSCTVVATITGTDAGGATVTITAPISDKAPATPQPLPPPGTVTPVMSAGDSTVTIGGTLPTGTTPADVANYTLTCTPTLPITNPVTTLPITVAATNGTNYVCSVVANLTAGGTLASNGTANATPNAPVVGATTPVPALGTWGLMLLSGVLAFLGLRRRGAAR